MLLPVVMIYLVTRTCHAHWSYRNVQAGSIFMKLSRRQFVHLAAGAAGLMAVPRIARAQAYPSRPVRIIVGVPAGGSPDIQARLLGQWLSEHLGQPFIVENRPGGGTNIATEAVVRSAPDGYTLLLATAINTWNAALYEKLNFDFIRDIAPVAGLNRQTFVMMVAPSFPAKTVPELTAARNSRPLCCSVVLVGTKRMLDLVTASQRCCRRDQP
jgi:tripartite-type tricarboxylate transporter receptor subunit TctC